MPRPGRHGRIKSFPEMRRGQKPRAFGHQADGCGDHPTMITNNDPAGGLSDRSGTVIPPKGCAIMFRSLTAGPAVRTDSQSLAVTPLPWAAATDLRFNRSAARQTTAREPSRRRRQAARGSGAGAKNSASSILASSMPPVSARRLERFLNGGKSGRCICPVTLSGDTNAVFQTGPGRLVWACLGRVAATKAAAAGGV